MSDKYRNVEVEVTRTVKYSRVINVVVPMSVPEDSVEDYIHDNRGELWDAVDESNYSELDFDDTEVTDVNVGEEASNSEADEADFTFDYEWND